MPTLEQNLDRIATALEAIALTLASHAGAVNLESVKVESDMALTLKAEAEAKQELARKEKEEITAKELAAQAAAKAKQEALLKAQADAAALEKAKLAAAASAAEAASAELVATSAGVKHTKEDVRKALQGYREIEGTAAMLELLRKHGGGAANLGELPEQYYGSVILAANAPSA